MIERFKNFLSRHIFVVPVIFAVLVLGGFISVGAYYAYKSKPTMVETRNQITKDPVEEAKSAAKDVATEPEAEKKAEEFTKNPPKTSAGNISSKSVKTSSGTAVVVSTGSAADTSKIQSLASLPAVSSFNYIDKTGSFPELGDMIKEYLTGKLLNGSELPYLYELNLIDCAECNYGGYWTGSYIYSGSNIVKAFGYITLNIGPYKDSPYRDDYMKLIFSHEYGHHYTMYHRWVDMDIPTGERFPSQYYSVRPLAYGATAVDYSLGWANCDAEIIAEDYSYFFSGYGYSGVASSHGYPSNPATKSYLVTLAAGTADASEVEEPETEPVPDTQPPVVSITSPSRGSQLTGSVSIEAAASDNQAVTKVDFYVDGAMVFQDTSAPYVIVWDTQSVVDGGHSLTVIATDSSGNEAQYGVEVVVNNSASADLEKPVVTIFEPEGTSYAWSAENLRIHAAATDNVSVDKIQIFINDNLVAEEGDGDIVRIWMYAGTPAGAYQLKVKAFDVSGNWSETSITVNKT